MQVWLQLVACICCHWAWSAAMQKVLWFGRETNIPGRKTIPLFLFSLKFPVIVTSERLRSHFVQKKNNKKRSAFQWKAFHLSQVRLMRIVGLWATACLLAWSAENRACLVILAWKYLKWVSSVCILPGLKPHHLWPSLPLSLGKNWAKGTDGHTWRSRITGGSMEFIFFILPLLERGLWMENVVLYMEGKGKI